MQQLTPEQRFLILEADVAEIKRKLEQASDVDSALLIRIDSFIGDLHRFEREHKNGIASLNVEVKTINARLNQLETNDAGIVEVLNDHKAYMEEMREEFHASQQQIIALLAGGSRRDD